MLIVLLIICTFYNLLFSWDARLLDVHANVTQHGRCRRSRSRRSCRPFRHAVRLLASQFRFSSGRCSCGYAPITYGSPSSRRSPPPPTTTIAATPPTPSSPSPSSRLDDGRLQNTHHSVAALPVHGHVRISTSEYVSRGRCCCNARP